MSIIDEVRREREDLARVLKKHTGIRRIVEDLYPDSAHFIYELLQNAEDTGATEAHFALTRTGLVFEHNGRPFEPRDIYAITDIGEGTKSGDDDKIGRFGVGFKAVFAYTETPHIWSPTFSFKITDLVLPSPLAAAPDLGNRTRFEFPFNNPKKPTDIAITEVAKGLSELAETTLLFLTHLKSVAWRVDGRATGKVLRVQHSENHIEVLKEDGAKVTDRCHFLKFDRPVQGLEKQRVAVAFALDFLPNVTGFDPTKPLAKQLRIIPAAPGRVAVFFPAEKEASGLRFHLHAPFVPELSRASIKETPANLPLFEQLAQLTASSLHLIRDLELLTPDFLATLPNPQDSIPARYKGIRSAIVDEMNTEPLTPTYAKTHAPAEQLLQSSAPLKSLLTDSDIELLVDYEDDPPHWAISASQKNSNVDRFLEGLAIEEWGIEEFVRVLRNKTGTGAQIGSQQSVTREQVAGWLREKSIEWHQEFYALLQTEYLSKRKWDNDHFDSLRIVRLTDGSHGAGSECFFVGDGVEHDEALRRVEPGVYTTGKSKVQKENARGFLEAIGVREVGEAELVEAILQRRYTKEAEIPDEKTYRKDFKRFVALLEKEPDKASLFAGYFIFQGVDNNNWWTPGGVFLDQPFLDTGLSAFYGAIGDEADRVALSPNYENCGVSTTKLARFAEAVGTQTELEVTETRCNGNPERGYLYSVRGERYTSPIDRDFTIEALEKALVKPSLAISKLIWNTMRSLPSSRLRAVYRKNESGGCHYAASQLVHLLRRLPWVPQSDGRFVRPAEATRDVLPGGFPFDPDWEWLDEVEFGKQLAQRSQEQLQKRALAKQLGFTDDETLDRAKRFAALPVDEQRRILAEQQAPFELPDHEPTNPTRRAERVAAEAATAPERTKEERTRSVSVNRDAVKEEAGQYLSQQYTNPDGQMMCQVCKKRLPFQLPDGTDYFERVELLPTLKRHHKQNYLALCPNHAAMFQHANGSTANLRQLVLQLIGNALPVVLAKEDTTIFFTKTHLADLKAIIRADAGRTEQLTDEEVDEAEGASPTPSGGLREHANAPPP